jgi:hypothetical protein
MTPASSRPRRTTRLAALGTAVVVVVATLAAMSWVTICSAQSAAALVTGGPASAIASASASASASAPVPESASVPPPASPPALVAARPPAAEQGVRWRDLKPSQQAVLKPLEHEWSSIGPVHKQKWIELSGNFAKRSPADQARIQGRMAEWARLTADERSQARLNFQEAKELDPNARKARWEAYQALSPEQKQRLAARAVHPAPWPSATARPTRVEAPSGRDPQLKSNIVPNTASAIAPKAIGPGFIQAGPGATTTLITKRPAPPPHQQTGQPKIAATPEFVNKATLLPKRGPQGAATRSAAAPASGTSLSQ